MHTDHRPLARGVRALAGGSVVAALLALGVTGCGSDDSNTVQAASNSASAPPASPALTPVAAADAFMAAWRAGDLASAGSVGTTSAMQQAARASVDLSSFAGRGCARPDQVPGDDPPETAMVCVYVLPFNDGEIHVAVAPTGSTGSTWQVVGVSAP